MLDSLDVSASALTAEHTRLNTIAQNLANANTTRDSRGRPNPYSRKEVVFEPARDRNGNAGVRVLDIRRDIPDKFPVKYDPGHPDADKEGYVKMPNVNVIEEMVDMIMASRAYEANVTTMKVTKRMAASALSILA